MTRPVKLISWIAAIFLFAAVPAQAKKLEGPIDDAKKVLIAFMDAFNARDAKAWVDTMHFPHVRMASGNVTVYQQPEDYTDAMDFSAFFSSGVWTSPSRTSVRPVA